MANAHALSLRVTFVILLECGKMKTFRSSLLLLIPFAYGGLLFNSDKILVNIGDIVTLDCINSLKANGIQITFNNKFVGAYEPIFSQVTNNNPSKYGVTKTLSASGYVLHLTVINFSNSDIGQYVCRDTVTVEEQSVSLDKRGNVYTNCWTRTHRTF
ncbi:hypothetical protein MAR_007530 [Mya arenaria]|uniref:Uncharacterized protein n=1 Tax=Mya arenaria TaxID=6604 RepID=A0ABY7DF54_MYAAR|nr:hypothetical protein MAR_007530 [Mya arenaria]